jgi:menaquinone-9 beta-reductase
MKSEIRNSKSEIAIVGAGPAGAAAAIRLASAGFAVTLVERERFPRQKLCGEFISPECLAHFRALGVLDAMLSAGGARLSKTVFYEPDGKSVAVPSQWFGQKENALSLSRAAMDLRLLEKARAVGVKVFEETQIVGLLTENEIVRGVKAKNTTGESFEIAADLTVDATGRARVLGKLAEKFSQRRKAETLSERKNPKSKIQNSKSKLVGFKAHLKNARIEADVCEIYFFRGGYGGLSFVENDLANHCFLICADVVKQFGGDAERIVREVVFQNKRAAQTLRSAETVFDWLAVAVDGFGARSLNPASNLLAIGDAGAFLDPFTGSGMLMESAELLAEAVAENERAPERIARRYESAHHEKFRRRLRVCSVLRRAAFVPHLAKAAINVLSYSDRARRLLARATRPAASAGKK